MKLKTTRFGDVEVLESDEILFPSGLIGIEQCTRWVLLADALNPALGWLQSVDRGELAMAVVSPRRFVSDYRVRVSSRETAAIGLESSADAQVLVLLSKGNDGLVVNLKAPLVIHLSKRLGRQVIAKDDHAVQYVLGATVPFRRSA
ncbi:Flagellar assembly factor FliW [Pirellulimonas nuda]|uniref:Flagellar assembly factor FliW n=1 Tax=Pirellulimonas nuda TaxID=2528009 RepID=A0A518DJS3_9BACT|nr:flagellar assembly protein FliW [Pirellulimonas nuda]QDU91728.1 Flagellar assembly factor FliW [Pirellulimonas nuda]